MSEHVLVLPPETPIGNEDRYVVKSVLGQGGFSIVYLARDTMLGTDVVVKEFYPKDIAARTDSGVGPRNESFVSVYASRLENFCSEAKLLTELAGTRGIPSIRDAFKFNGTAYIVMNYTTGNSLSEYLDEKGGQLGWIKTASVLTPVAEALKILHTKGIVHKDISPSNILVTDDGGVLLDFGSAASPERALKHGYAPIELYSNNILAGPATDIYSLAATAYKCLTGLTPNQAADRVVSDSLLLPSSVGSDISPDEEALLMKALAVRPDDRMSADDELIGLFHMRQVTKSQSAPTPAAAKSEATAQTAPVHKTIQPKAAVSASADGHTIVLPLGYIGPSITEGDVTVVLDCSELHDYSEQVISSEPSHPQIGVDTEKAAAALKESGEKFGKAAEQAGQQLGKVAGQAGEKIAEAIKTNPAKFKKIATAVIVIFVILMGGTYYYNNVYLNSFGVQYGKALDMYDEGDYRNSFWQLNRTVELHPDPNEKQQKDIDYLRVMLLFKGYPVEDDVPLGTLPQPDDYIDFSMKLADDGDMRHMIMLAELCFQGSLERHEMFFKQIGFDRLKKYADTIAKENPNYRNLKDLNDNIAERFFIIARDKLDKSILDHAVEYMKKAGYSDSECERARKENERWIQRRLDDLQAKKEVDERKRKQREADRKAKLEHEAWLREQKEKDRIAAEQNRKAREERKRQQEAARKANQQKQQAQKKAQTAKSSAAKPKTTVQKQQPKKAQQPHNISGMTLAQKVTAVRKAMAKRDAQEQARLRQKAEQEAAAKGISVNDALMILLGIGR